MDLSQSIPSFAKNASPMLLSTIFTSFIIPLQVHPMSQGHWPYSQAPMVAATIASARPIGRGVRAKSYVFFKWTTCGQLQLLMVQMIICIGFDSPLDG